MPAYAELPKNKPLLSLILQREGALTDAQTDRALREWHYRRQVGCAVPYGQIVMSLGYMTFDALRPFVALQRQLAAPPDGPKRLGRLMLENGLIRPTRLLDALRAQQLGAGPRLGELLIAEGELKSLQLEILLRFQGRTIAAI